MNSLELACRYSLPPNKLGYCGPQECSALLEKFIESPASADIEKVKKALGEFHALMPYIELIAEKNEMQAFDKEVLEAYWIGNSLLERVEAKDLQKLVLKDFLGKGFLPRGIAEEKAGSVKEGMTAHHSFHVLHINFLNSELSAIVKNISDCLVQWGEVKDVTVKGLRVKGVELFREGNELKLREKIKTVENPYSLEAGERDFVSVHWGQAIQVLSKDELSELKKYTLKNLEAVNSGN